MKTAHSYERRRTVSEMINDCRYAGKCANEWVMCKCLTCIYNPTDPRIKDYFVEVEGGDE